MKREKEEATLEKYRDIIEGQARFHREDTALLAAEFEKLRIEKEQSRGRVTQKLPNYDGSNLDFDEWEEKVIAISKCNNWDVGKLLEALPASLSGQSKRALDHLKDEGEKIQGLCGRYPTIYDNCLYYVYIPSKTSIGYSNHRGSIMM